MGLYWLTTGLVLIRQEAHKAGNRLFLAFAILGVVTGLLVITRSLSRQWMPEVWLKGLLGSIILLTGLEIEITAVTPQGYIAQAVFRFDNPLEDPEYVWMYWNPDTRFRTTGLNMLSYWRGNCSSGLS